MIISIFLNRYGYYLVLNIKPYCGSEIVSFILTNEVEGTLFFGDYRDFYP